MIDALGGLGLVLVLSGGLWTILALSAYLTQRGSRAPSLCSNSRIAWMAVEREGEHALDR